MERRGFAALLLSVVLGCHAPSRTMHALQALPEDAAGAAGSVTPGTLAAERACEDQHDARACTQAAERYSEGRNGHAYDPTKAFRLAGLGCDGGDGLACAILGWHHENGIGAPWSPAQAIAIYEKSCDGQTGLGCSRLGAMYAKGHGVDRDHEKARKYRDLAHKYWLAACLGTEPRWCLDAASSGNPDDPASADELSRRALVQRACDRGIARGCVEALDDQLLRRATSLEAAMGKLDTWCSGGESAACAELALIHDSSALIASDDDPATAVALSARACALGDPGSCVTAAVKYESELTGPATDRTPLHYFLRACTRGFAMGCLYLAQDLAIVTRSPQSSAQLAQRGCELGSREACRLYARFADGSDDPSAATTLFEACRVGAHEACAHLIVRDAELPRTMFDPIELYHDACKAKVASACRRIPTLAAARIALLDDLRAVIAHQDAAAFAALVAGDLTVSGIRFADPGCAAQFSAPVRLTAAQHPALVRCMAKLALRVEAAADPLSAPLLTYEPGGELAIAVSDGVVAGISASSKSTSPGSLPLPPPPPPAHGPVSDGNGSTTPHNVSPTTVEALRISGEKIIVPDPETKTAISAAGRSKLVGSFKLCLNAHGTIASIEMLKSTGSLAYDRKLERKMSTWRYRPFLLDGEPTPVCTAVTFIYSQH